MWCASAICLPAIWPAGRCPSPRENQCTDPSHGGLRLRSPPHRKDHPVFTNPNVEAEADKLLATVSRALTVFGAPTPPADPPVFAAPRDLEDDLGRGQF